MFTMYYKNTLTLVLGCPLKHEILFFFSHYIQVQLRIPDPVQIIVDIHVQLYIIATELADTGNYMNV